MTKFERKDISTREQFHCPKLGGVAKVTLTTSVLTGTATRVGPVFAECDSWHRCGAMKTQGLAQMPNLASACTRWRPPVLRDLRARRAL